MLMVSIPLLKVEIKDTTVTVRSASYMYLDLHIEIDSEGR